MGLIGGSDTTPEIMFRKQLHALGFRYRLHDRSLPGTPDVVLPRHGTVIFIHGCFWHQHANCRIASRPQSNAAFWRAKFERNVSRDRREIRRLRRMGWRVFVVWECQVSSTAKAKARAARIAARIRKQNAA